MLMNVKHFLDKLKAKFLTKQYTLDERYLFMVKDYMPLPYPRKRECNELQGDNETLKIILVSTGE